MLKNMTLDELWVEILKDDVRKYPQASPDCPTDEIILNDYVKSEDSNQNAALIEHINSCSGCFYKSTLLFLQHKNNQ